VLSVHRHSRTEIVRRHLGAQHSCMDRWIGTKLVQHHETSHERCAMPATILRTLEALV
jgi:hypothetical protein